MIERGIHLPVQGCTDRAVAVAEALDATAALFLVAENAHDTAKLPRVDTRFVRLWTPAPGESTAAYADRVQPIVQDWYSVGLPAIFVPGNEPEYADGWDVTRAWEIGQWQVMAHLYARELRQRWPQIVLAAPAVRAENTQFLTDDYAVAFDVLTCHCYWEATHPEDIANPNLGGAWRHTLAHSGSKPVWVTEVNSVGQTDVAQIRAWVRTLGTDSDQPSVRGYILYLADGQGGWATFDVTPEEAAAIAAPGDPVPPDPPVVPPPPPATPDPGDPEAIMADGKPYYMHFFPLDEAAYAAIVRAGSFADTESPLLAHENYLALMRVAEENGFDALLPLAFMRSEGHMGTDPGLVAARVNNFGGIKYVGSPGTYDSGIPADTGGTYAGFADLAAYFERWWGIMNNTIIGPDFQAGNLIGAVEHYTNGVGTGWNKVTFYNESVHQVRQMAPAPFPQPIPDPSNPAPLPRDTQDGLDVAGAKRRLEAGIAAFAMSAIGQEWMGPGCLVDDSNGGPRRPAGWCEGFKEWAVWKQTGLRYRMPSAEACFRHLLAEGVISFDKNPGKGKIGFYSWAGDAFGHVVVISENPGMTVGTSIVPNAILELPIDHYTGWAGYADADEVIDAVATLVARGGDPALPAMNVYGRIDGDGNRVFPWLVDADGRTRIIGHGFHDVWDADGPQQGILRYGYPLGNERDERLANGAVLAMQWFERARFEAHPEGVMRARLGAEWLTFWRHTAGSITTVEPTTDNIDAHVAEFWKGHGGIAAIGLPLTAYGALPGSAYPGQVFERYVLERHDESADWPVQQRLLGLEWQNLLAQGLPTPEIGA